jgi:glycosyltransferase involved in cell wall biosynthesis
MSRQKILWLCSWYPNKTDLFNGDFIQRHAQAASLLNDIYVIHVIAVPGFKQQAGIEEEVNSSGNLTERLIYFKALAGFIGRIISNYRSIRLYKSAIKEYIKASGRPALLHVHIPMKAGIAGLWAKRRFKLPLLVSEHWGIYNKEVEDNYYQRSLFFKTATKRIIRGADIFVSVSSFLIQAIRQLAGIRNSQIIPNTVNTNLFVYKSTDPVPFRFIHVSNMVSLKNAEGILRAFKKLNEERRSELIMVGNTGDEIVKYAAGLELQNTVSFRGEISYERVAREMQGSNCLVLFSNIENSPCVIAEALCCGLPVIATRVGGIPELIDDSNGSLVMPGNENELKEAMERIMNEYPGYDRKKISATAIQKFSYESIGRQFNELYLSLIDKRK